MLVFWVSPDKARISFSSWQMNYMPFKGEMDMGTHGVSTESLRCLSANKALARSTRRASPIVAL